MTLPLNLKIAVAMNVILKGANSIVLSVTIFFMLTQLVIQESLAQVYIPLQLRCKNYVNYYDIGSCTHANTITVLHFHNHHKLANWIPTQYSGRGYHSKINTRFNKWGLTTLATFSSSKAILDFAHVNSLPAIISFDPNHSCIFLGWYVDPNSLQITHAYVLNPNHPRDIETPTYTSFMNNWRVNDGEAVVIVPRRK